MTRLRYPMVGAVLALGAVLTFSAQSTATDAGWSEATVAKGEFFALTVVAPTILGCTAGGTDLSPTLTAQWSFPVGSGYTAPTNINLYYSNDGLLSNLVLIGAGASTSGPNGSGVYTTTYNIGLLGGVLNRQAAIGFETTVNGWTSFTRATALARWPLIGSNSCTVN
ncbi:hypothetical protein [Agromyces albus]|uniref:hypothetical protein n=1 Tax=Agromyces albus TaxID=205332 RepID=UPI00277DACFE|nr:hypothetical protein [Agromyces albus]MDQ0574511.1 hypothetical protein [Agromyces albus]